MTFAKAKTKKLDPVLKEEHLDAIAAGYKKADGVLVRKGAALARDHYEKLRNNGTLVHHPKRLVYHVNLEDNTITHDCCGMVWDAGRWSAAFIPPRYRPGMPLLINCCPICGALARPAGTDGEEQASTHLANMLERDITNGTLKVVGEA